MDFRKYHDRHEYPYESRRTSDHGRHRHERRSDDYHHTSGRMRNRESQHDYQDEFDVPASQPEKTDYVQSWLQRSQATRARPPEPVPEDRPRKVSPRVHMVKQASQKKKRTRSESPEPEHQRETRSPVALRFEKRSRHKTRHDKYDYKPEVDRNKRRASGKEHRREDSYGSLEDVQRHKRSGYQHTSQQRSNHHAQRTDHGPSRHRSSKAKEMEALPKRPDHISRAAEPRPSRKQQAEDKELEELSAFFTRRADGERAEAEKTRHRTGREQRHDTAAVRLPTSNVRQHRTHDSPTTSLHPSRSIGSTRRPSSASLRPDTHVSSCGDDPRNILPAGPSSRSTTYFTWSISDRGPDARAPVSNDSTSERPQRSIQSSARKVVLQERKIKSPNVVLEDLKIRPTSRVKHRPRKRIVYKDAQVQTSFDAETDQNRQHAKKPIPQYQDSAVMTADDNNNNNNIKERVSMLAAESTPDMNKRPVDEQPPPNTTAARPIGAPPQPQSQPQPQAWVTYNPEDRLISRPFIAARTLLGQGGWQTYQEPSAGQAVGCYTQPLPPSRIQAVMHSHRLTPLRPAADNIPGLPAYPSTQTCHVPTQEPPRESMEDYINRIEQEALQNSTNNEEMDELQPRGPDLTESVEQQQLGPGSYPEGNNMLIPDTTWYDQHPLPTHAAHIEVQDPEYFDLEHYGQGIGGQDTRLPRLWEDPSGF